MDNRAEARDFLTSRRARLTPERAGVRVLGGLRRVPGLRREEVAQLAGVSTDYYTRLERGNLAGVSDSVVDALVRALLLDEAEAAHLADLAAAANRRSRVARRARSRPVAVRPGVQRVLDAMSGPAYVRDHRFDVLALNAAGRALHPHLVVADGEPPANLARHLLLDPGAREHFVEWERVAMDLVAALRIEAGRAPHDQRLTELVGELAMRSEEFRGWWARHDVRLHTTSTKRLRHPVAGELELTGEALALPGDEDLVVILYTVEPGSTSEAALRFLGSWAQDAQGPGEERQTLPGTAADA